jgi:hypothetical protein
MEEILINRRQLIGEDLVQLLDDVGITLHRALLRSDEVLLTRPAASSANAIGDFRETLAAAALAAMEGENALWAGLTRFDGFIHLTSRNAVAVTDVHRKPLKAIAKQANDSQ